MDKEKKQLLYIQLIMKKLYLETKGQTGCKAYCDPFKMRLHIEGILGKDYNSEEYHDALQSIVRMDLAQFGGMYLTDRGATYVERLTIIERSGYVLPVEADNKNKVR